jgi:virginiamycin B lyase
MFTLLLPAILTALASAAELPAVQSVKSPDPSATSVDQSADPDTLLTEWTVPWERSRPRDPFADAQGRVWFVGQAGNYVAYLNPATGQFKRYQVEEGTHPHNLVVSPKGEVWFTGNRNGRLVRLDPATGKLTDYMMPDSAVEDPHTMTFDAAGNAWFTAQQSDAVGHIDTRTGTIRLWHTESGSRPYGIMVAPDGKVWFDLFGTNKLGMIDPKVMGVKTFALPNQRSRPRRIAITHDGMIWYGDYTRGYLGQLDPKTGDTKEYALPGGAMSLPYGMALDGQGRIWVAETGPRPNRLVAFDPARGMFTDTVQVGGGEVPNTIRHMTYDSRTSAIWFGTDRNTIGRLVVRGRETT